MDTVGSYFCSILICVVVYLLVTFREQLCYMLSAFGTEKTTTPVTKTFGDRNGQHTDLNDFKTIKSPRGGSSESPDKTTMENNEPAWIIFFKDYKSVANGREKSVSNISENEQCSDNNEFSVEKQRDLMWRQLLNYAKMPDVKCYLHTLSQYRKFSSDPEYKHKRESAKEVTETYELKKEEVKNKLSLKSSCSGFSDKTTMKNDELWDDCTFTEFKPVVNGMEQNVCNVSEKEERSDNNEFSVENKRDLLWQQLLNYAKMPAVKSYLHTLRQYRKFSSDAENKHKGESAKEVTETYELKKEESKKKVKSKLSLRSGSSESPDKTAMKNDELWDNCGFKKIESMIKEMEQNVCNVFEKAECSDNNELSVENKRDLIWRQLYLHTLSQYKKFSSDAENKHKRESAKEVTETCELKAEECKKRMYQLYDRMIGRLFAEVRYASFLLTKRTMLMQYGQEISDFILGVHFAVEDIKSLYSEWSEKRENTMQLFITTARNLDSLKNVPEVGIEIIKLLNVGGGILSNVPFWYCPQIGQLISAVSNIASAVMPPSNPKSADIDKVGITLSLLQDLEVSSVLYQKCLSCDQQIQNTRERIEEFYLAVRNGNCECLIEISDFLREIMELNPVSNTFYKRLRRSIEKTIQKDLKLDLETSFCSIFVEHPCALNIVDKLDWCFTDEGFKFGSLENRCQELSIVLMNYNSLALDDILFHIKSCIEIFGNQKLAVERTLSRFQAFE